MTVGSTRYEIRVEAPLRGGHDDGWQAVPDDALLIGVGGHASALIYT